MQQPSFDPGLTQQVGGVLTRAINKDGSFNVERRGGSWRDIHPYLHMINMGWTSFFGVLFLGYLAVNSIFAVIYTALGPGQIQGANAATPVGRFLDAFFFSAHTLTTVGYGNLAPAGIAVNFLAAFEAMVGLMGFALATGLLFGRVSKPSARFGFSHRLLIAPYQDRTALEFRIVNLRSNVLIEIEASIMLMTVELTPEGRERRYQPLRLERKQVYFLPLTWTIVHPIDETSPLFGRTAQELETLQAEVLILLKGFDDTFSQTVNARYSYRYDEMEWGAHFGPAFHIGQQGQMILDVNRVGDFVRADDVIHQSPQF